MRMTNVSLTGKKYPWAKAITMDQVEDELLVNPVELVKTFGHVLSNQFTIIFRHRTGIGTNFQLFGISGTGVLVAEGDLNQNLPIHARPTDISADLKELEIARDPYTHVDLVAHGCLGPDPKATIEFLRSALFGRRKLVEVVLASLDCVDPKGNRVKFAMKQAANPQVVWEGRVLTAAEEAKGDVIEGCYNGRFVDQGTHLESQVIIAKLN